MQWVEMTGRTVEEAREAALAELGIGEGDAEVVVVSEAKPGLFGRVRSEARVRARVMPSGPPPKDTRRKSRSDGRRTGGRRPSGSKRASTATRADDGQAEDTRADDPRTNGKENAVSSDDAGQVDEVEVPLEEQGDVAISFVEGVMKGFGLSASVNREVIDEDTVRVAVAGDDLGILIGNKGRTLDALQDLTRTAVFRETGARHGYVVVDVNDYRAKRREALARFTEGVAAEVVSAGERKSLEPMTPADRKVVHDTINGIDGVTTSSQGEEPRRYVVISPA
jgi:spoIIIJ-associated protein